MKNWVPIALAVAVILVAGYAMLVKFRYLPSQNNVACTMEAKMCPDGTTVGRVPPRCEFTPCPTGGPKDSGIAGTVLLGPNCPVERIPPEEGCEDKPYATNLVVTTEDGSSVIKEFSSDENGKFKVSVPPGVYAIRSAEAANVLPYCANQGSIIVDPGMFADITVSCDTGLR